MDPLGQVGHARGVVARLLDDLAGQERMVLVDTGVDDCDHLAGAVPAGGPGVRCLDEGTALCERRAEEYVLVHTRREPWQRVQDSERVVVDFETHVRDGLELVENAVAESPERGSERRAVRRDPPALGGDGRGTEEMTFGLGTHAAELDDDAYLPLGPRLLEEVGRHRSARVGRRHERGGEKDQGGHEARPRGRAERTNVRGRSPARRRWSWRPPGSLWSQHHVLADAGDVRRSAQTSQRVL